MSTAFDGVGLFCFWFEGVGTPITAAEAAAYRDAGVDYALVKVSDGLTGGGQVAIGQIQAAEAGGLRVIPWGFLYGTVNVPEQVKVLKDAAGGGFTVGVLDIEAGFNFTELVGNTDGMSLALCTWGNPLAVSGQPVGHPGAPSIGLWADAIGGPILPQAYAGDWRCSPAEAISIMQASYAACRLVNLPPLIPVGNTSQMLAFGQAAKAAGHTGVVGWRHGAGGITPASFQGLAGLFASPAPNPAPTPTPTPAPVTVVQLATPTSESQLSVPGTGWNDCGEAQIASIATDATSVAVSPTEVATWAQANGAAAANGETTAAQLQAEGEHFGAPLLSAVNATIAQTIPGALERKHRAIALISSNSDGVPTAGTGIGHWVQIYGYDSLGRSYYMNTLGPTPGSTAVANLAPYDLGLILEVSIVMPADGGQPKPGTLGAGSYVLPGNVSLVVPS